MDPKVETENYYKTIEIKTYEDEICLPQLKLKNTSGGMLPEVILERFLRFLWFLKKPEFSKKQKNEIDKNNVFGYLIL